MSRRKQLKPKAMKEDDIHEDIDEEPSSKIRKELKIEEENPEDPSNFTKSVDKFDCQLCEERFESIGSLQTHTLEAHVANNEPHSSQNHPNSTALECQVCSSKLGSFGAFAMHMRSHLNISNQSINSDSQLKCDLCSHKFSTIEKLQKHHRTHFATKLPRIRCSQCPQLIFQNSIELGIHSAEAHLRIVHQCAICFETYGSIHDFKEHFMDHGDPREVPACRVCQSSFESEEVLSLHIQFVHQINRDQISSNSFPISSNFRFPPLPLDFIGSGGDTKVDKNHRLRCSVCDEEFDGEECLDEHRLISHCKVLRADRCSVCQAQISSPADISLHSKLHVSSSGMISCVICRQSVRNQTHLEMHAHFHLAIMSQMTIVDGDLDDSKDEETPEVEKIKEQLSHNSQELVDEDLKTDVNAECPFCSKSVKFHELLVHINGCQCKTNSVTPPAVYPQNPSPKAERCPICGLSFNTSIRLDAHIKKHNSTSKSICQICARSFQNKESLTAHMKVHKGNLELAAKIQ